MIRAGFVALLCAVLSLSVFGQSVNWSTGVVYEYDGSGNVRKIGTDAYVYDTAQRLIRGSVAGSQQSYTYDSFGNRKACEAAGGGDCQYGFTVDSSTNRVAGRSYDKRGNMLQLPEGNTLEYDELGMVRKENGDGRTVHYIYTADDERIAVYEADTKLSTDKWEWTVRGLDRKPLREFTSEGVSGAASFKWAKDHIWRDGALLASRQPDAGAPGGVSTYHYHVDHLGTPRQVTSSSSVIVGRHDYLPFGPELTSTRINEPKLQDLKFTGHERDEARDRPSLDYMHARYYEPRLGRFLSVDPVLDIKRSLHEPQSWNRYSYVVNNPIRRIDPDGRVDGNSDDFARQLFPDDRAAQLAFDQDVAEKTAGLAAAFGSLFVPGPEDVVLGAIAATRVGRAIGWVGDKIAGAFGRGADDTLQKIFEVQRGKGNFGLGSMSAGKADKIGRAWVGDGAKPIMHGTKQIGLISEDGSKVYRFATKKVKSGRYQANLEEVTTSAKGKRTVVRDAHIDIVP